MTRPLLDTDFGRILDAAKHHVRTAHSKAASGAAFADVDTPIHAGAAVELLAKLVLAKVHPGLLAHAADSPHAMLEAVVSGTSLRTKKPGIRTVDAGLAVEMVCRISPQAAKHQESVKDLLKARNHSGLEKIRSTNSCPSASEPDPRGDGSARSAWYTTR